MDERGLIQAVVGGFQDRLEDLRSYGKKMQLFFSVYGLPDPENNVVSVILTSQQGKVYKRSLDITDETPPASNPTALRQWAAEQLGLEESTLGNVQYDRDLLRLVDLSTLEYLAASIGAILYQSSLVADQRAANQHLVDTYFPRLKIKGTAQSFDVLGRALGFDDVRVTPLWSRMSPHRPEDVGNPINDPDYLADPAFFPRQQVSVLYDPLDVRDGPFYQWTGTCSNGTASTSYYTSAINGFNPWVEVIVLGSITNGTAAHVAAGSYTLAGGAPNLNAYVEPENSSFRFEALVEGASMNGLVITVGTFGYNGTDRTVTIYDRLSSVKYRSSYFDLGLTVNIDRAEEVFGTQPASRNPDIASGNYIMDGVAGTAVSPYRAWRTGSIAVTTLTQDFYTQTVVAAGTTVVVARVQSAGTNQEIIVDNLIDAGVQVAQSLEEVRPATRFPRRSASGLLIDDSTHFACYTNAGTLFTTSSGSVYSGSHPLTPLGGYTAELGIHLGPSFAINYRTVLGRSYTVWGTPDFVTFNPVAYTVADADPETFVVALAGTSAFFIVKDTLTGSVVPQSPYLINNAAYDAEASVDPSNGTIWNYNFLEANLTNLVYSGTYDFGNGTYFVHFPNGEPPAARAVAIWTVTDSEVIRPEPTRADKAALRFNCQVRPEDDDNGLLDEQADDYPWLREAVGGGEQVEIDTYIPEGVPVDVVDYTTAFQNQSGVDVDVYGFESQNKNLRTRVQDRPYDGDYQPGIRAIGYSGSFRNLASLSGSEISLIVPAPGSATGTYAAPTEYDILFNPGYALYHVGVIQDVLVADPVKFYGSHHRTGLVGWMPLNEHPEDNLDVRDVAQNTEVSTSLLNVFPADRLWSDERGWYLSLSSTGTVQTTVTRGLHENFTLSFWLVPQVMADTPLVRYDPVYIDLVAAGTQLNFYAKDINGLLIPLGSQAVTPGAFNFVAITKDVAQYSFGVGTLTTPLTLTAYPGLFADFDEVANSTLSFQSAGFHDLRLWKLPKTADDLNLVRYHDPVPTDVLYQLGFIETANRQDRYGLKALESKWITPDVMPPWYRTSRQGLVRRYNADGSYSGASRFKEVGLGDGHALPSQMFLGYVLPTVEVGGTAVVSGSWGALPGVNSLWANDTTTLYPMEQCNPVRDRIWVRGLEDGAMYEVKLEGVTTRTFVTGTAAYSGTNIFAGTYSQQLTGAEVVLANGGKQCFWGTSAGTLVQVVDSGGTQTPPQWMYLNQRITDKYPGVSEWTKRGYTAHQQGVDITGNPDVVAISGNVNSALLVAALGNNGRLDFENTSVFAPARYRLTLESGNIGPTDEDFDGFTVELNLNENILEAVLLRGQSGFNVRGTDIIEFVSTTPAVNGTWLLSIQWFNALRDTAKGTMRQLAIYSYKIEKLETEVFRIEVNPAGIYPEIVPVPFSEAPGGWLMRVNSYGTVVETAHEGTVYPRNDTVASKLPLSDILTGMTNDKREDILVSAVNPPSFWAAGTVATDPSAPVMPTFGVLIDTLV